jgi:integrase
LKTLAEYETTKVSFDKDILFADYMLNWLEVVKCSIEQNTYESYTDIFTRYIEPYFRRKKITLQKLEPYHIQEYYANQLKSVSPNTVLKQHANIRKALQHAVKMNMIVYNPSDRVTLPKKQKYVANFLNDDQINEVLGLFADEPMYPAVLLTAFYALRRSEVLALKWQSVDFKNNTITIKDTVVQYKTLIDKERTKNKASHRTLPLTDEISNYLQQLKQRQLENSALLGSGYIQNDYVCKRDNGEPFRPNYITERFYRVIRRSSIDNIRFHDLRHSAASLLLASGFSLKEIQEFLGHGDLGTTANIYAHLQFQAKKNMAASMQSKLQIPIGVSTH